MISTQSNYYNYMSYFSLYYFLILKSHNQMFYYFNMIMMIIILYYFMSLVEMMPYVNKIVILIELMTSSFYWNYVVLKLKMKENPYPNLLQNYSIFYVIKIQDERSLSRYQGISNLAMSNLSEPKCSDYINYQTKLERPFTSQFQQYFKLQDNLSLLKMFDSFLIHL